MATVDDLLGKARAGLSRLTPAQAAAEQHTGALLVDIRTETQRGLDGEIPGALVVDRTVLEWRLDPASRWRRPEAADHGVRIILICNEGYSSSLAAASLQALGLHRATDVAGGFQAWAAAGLPVDQDGAGTWDAVYAAKADEQTSWHEDVPRHSLDLLERLGVGPSDPLVDVGGGTSTLVDHLLDRGFRDLTVLDLSALALRRSRRRLGHRSAAVRWVVADVTAWRPRRTYAAWHDRATYHFLTDPAARAGYRAALSGAVAAGGAVVVATFAADGPDSCSGLPVRRYGAEELAAELGLTLVASERVEHRTPWGSVQPFTYVAGRLGARPPVRAGSAGPTRMGRPQDEEEIVTAQQPDWPEHQHDAVTHDHPHYHLTHNYIERVGGFEHLAYQHSHEHSHGAEQHSHYPHEDFEREHRGEAHEHDHAPAGTAAAAAAKTASAAKKAVKKAAPRKKAAAPAEGA